MKNTLHQNTSGFVSIIVTMTIMIILSLISIGFARIMQREATQAADRQLSTQAFYAAESGVNDAMEVLRTNPTAAKTDCGNPAAGPYSGLNPVIDAPTTNYTCLLVDPAPGSVVFDSVDIDKSTVVKLYDGAGGNINAMTFNWQSADPANVDTFHTNPSHKLPPTTGAGSWGADTGILRVSIYPVPLVAGAPAPGTRAQLNNDARTYFLYPRNGGVGAIDTVSWANPADNGALIDGNCHANKTPRRCAVTINNLPNGYMYYVRLKSIYNIVTTEITATDSAGTGRTLAGAQTKIDATGRTSDVFRRIQVRIPVESFPDVPEYAIETAGDLCKRIMATSTLMSDECDPTAPGGGTTTTNPPPPLPPPPPPPPPQNCAFQTVSSYLGDTWWYQLHAPTPAGDPANAAPILNSIWISPNASVYLNNINCAGNYTRARLRIATGGAWTTPPDIIEVVLRKKSTLEILDPITPTPCIQATLERFLCLPNTYGVFQDYEWNLVGLDVTDLEMVLLIDGYGNGSNEPEGAWVQSITFF